MRWSGRRFVRVSVGLGELGGAEAAEERAEPWQHNWPLEEQLSPSPRRAGQPTVCQGGGLAEGSAAEKGKAAEPYLSYPEDFVDGVSAEGPLEEESEEEEEESRDQYDRGTHGGGCHLKPDEVGFSANNFR
ncbi:hypothetical protein H920_18538 [Fukomys damarensis]|uniref:Uncharacterized protein n=1 Tax=Fukomys damarensis TaxID=885580 RepID=A0A091CMH6_FUKDA|nr:hypothetical protein H920_18538 [Fukomys damarensis]